MGLLNPTLHDAGATPGSALHWSLSSTCAAERIAAFGPAPERAVEDFERWSPLVAAFELGVLVLAFFDPVPQGFEAFEVWAGGTFLDAFPEVLLQATAFGVETLDGWLSAPWAGGWGDVVGEAALFGGQPRDDFESWALTPATVWTNATFDAGTKSAEGFEGTWAVMKTL